MLSTSANEIQLGSFQWFGVFLRNLSLNYPSAGFSFLLSVWPSHNYLWVYDPSLENKLVGRSDDKERWE